MESIADILKSRIEKFNSNPIEVLKTLGKEYKKNWNNGVNYFLIEINKDRQKEGLEPLKFIAIRQKLSHIKEIDDLRWFYYNCKQNGIKLDKTGKPYTFSRIFFSSLNTNKK